ncbi:MAG: HypC/HybG/HupF family hydrogenase formation chaperone [Campylobacterales bacterium]|nr:HypC/HybG/HupF family hydrogenase formation chaperone [Campylobacterales bacterium]
MCLSIPSKIVKVNVENSTAIVDTMGVKKEVSLDLLNESVNIGDFVLIHVGYAMNKIDEADALETLKLFEEILSIEEIT